MVTLSDIINDFEKYAAEHKFIEAFSWGMLDEVSTKDSLYPLLFLTPTNSIIEGSETKLRFEMYIMDVLELDRSNQKSVMDIMLRIGNDVISSFYYDDDNLEYELDELNVPIQPFEARFDDNLAGWIFTITLSMQSQPMNCITPTDD